VPKLRVRFTKLGKIRFTSHRDMARMWERSLRRSGVEVAYSEGFSPRPKLHFGLALSTGHESLAEYLDIDTVDVADAPPLVTADGTVVEGAPPDLLERLTATMPNGIDCVAIGPLRPGMPSLQEAVTSCTWQIDVIGLTATEATDAVARLLAAPEVWVDRERKGKTVTDDLRPMVLGLECLGELEPAYEGGPVPVRLRADLATQPRGVRPRELLAALSPESEEHRVLRLHQWTSPDGAHREEPLPASATWAPHAELRAS
jgi:uncharacterized protein (DUF2344 family)